MNPGSLCCHFQASRVCERGVERGLNVIMPLQELARLEYQKDGFVMASMKGTHSFMPDPLPGQVQGKMLYPHMCASSCVHQPIGGLKTL